MVKNIPLTLAVKIKEVPAARHFRFNRVWISYYVDIFAGRIDWI